MPSFRGVSKKNSYRPAYIVFFLVFMFCTYMNHWSFPIAFEIRTQNLADVKEYDDLSQRLLNCENSNSNSDNHNSNSANHNSKVNVTRTEYHGRATGDGVWFSLNNTSKVELYVYSAFYDDRNSLGTLPVVRVIAVTDIPDNSGVVCVVYYKDPDIKTRTVDTVRKVIGAGAYRHKSLFQETVFTCLLGDEVAPEYITLLPERHPATKKAKGLKNVYKVPVEVPQKYDHKMNLGLCVSLSYWYHNPYRLVEWIEIQRILGIDSIIVYNNSLASDASTVFTHYTNREPHFLELRQSASFLSDPGEFTLHLQMSPVINDCMYRNMHRFRKILVIDLDEMIVPYMFDNITQMLGHIESLIPEPHPARAYAFRNAYFFLDYPQDESQPENLLTARFNKHVEVSEMGYASKSIIDPLSCVCMHNHYCWQWTPLYERQDVLVEVAAGFGVNRHYKKCHLDNCAELMAGEPHTDNRMLALKPLIVRAMNTQMRHLRILKAL